MLVSSTLELLINPHCLVNKPLPVARVGPCISLHRDKIAGVSFFRPRCHQSLWGRPMSVCPSPSPCGWCHSVYGSPKTAQLNPQIETPTAHLQTTALVKEFSGGLRDTNKVRLRNERIQTQLVTVKFFFFVSVTLASKPSESLSE